MIVERGLRRGDVVALVSPAGPASPEALDRAAAELADWGLVVDRLDSVRPVRKYLADTDARRAGLFQAAWTDPVVTAVIAARGGYGTHRILDLLDWEALRAAGPKIFAGSSDLTALHQAIEAHLGLPTLFSPMPAATFWDEEAKRHLHRALWAPGEEIVFSGLETVVPGTARGVLTGGTLSVLAAGAGAPEYRPPEGAIAVFEDIAEAPYRIDRLLTQLSRSGWFGKVSGIALGSWFRCGDPGEVRAVLLDRLGTLGVPVVGDLRFGHCPGAVTLPFGTRAVLDAEAGTLTVRGWATGAS
ncbi:S66 peptidase family protein [Amycolatopsis pigmentata]|uniref:LD-carboxypeptidase n=1 Tax=Amycolatopsis pigmentata TaxID=450801 RepID=A0ABW5FP66_9PSEU